MNEWMNEWINELINELINLWLAHSTFVFPTAILAERTINQTTKALLYSQFQ